jgi:hypothetical protein
MEENEAKSVKAIDHEEVTFQDPFNIARLDTSTKNTSTRTTALPLFYKKRKCTHLVQIANESSENILGIDFLQKIRLHLDPKS